jgi:ryanodine receptor 2
MDVDRYPSIPAALQLVIHIHRMSGQYQRFSSGRLATNWLTLLGRVMIFWGAVAPSKGMPVTYEPKPIDTSHIKLREQILELTEMLGRNSHDVWARQRLADGWRFGATRNDQRREHPCLVPYEELPESEKQYDRNAALETLKTIVALGYDILRRNGPESR